MYFQSVELTGSSDGLAKKPKLSLINIYSKFIFQDMDELAREQSNGRMVKVVIVKQMDGAGPHREIKLKNFMETEFRKRDWLLFPTCLERKKEPPINCQSLLPSSSDSLCNSSS